MTNQTLFSVVIARDERDAIGRFAFLQNQTIAEVIRLALQQYLAPHGIPITVDLKQGRRKGPRAA